MNRRSPSLCLLGLLGLALFASPVAAQLFDSGPSDPSLFDAVTNVPTDMNFGDFAFCGNDGLNSQINVSEGGSIGEFFSVYTGCEMNISGGSVDNFFYAFPGSEVNISGGTIGVCFDIFADTVVNISGGVIGDNFRGQANSEINLYGSDIVVDGVSLDASLTPGEAFTILDREVTFSMLLADGSPFSIELNLVNMTNADFLSSGANLTVTLVSAAPEPILGDCNQDGVVDFADIPAFIDVLIAGSFLAEADCDLDGEVTFSDIPSFIAILSAI